MSKVETRVEQDVFVVTINRPEVRNAVDNETATAQAEFSARGLNSRRRPIA